MSNLSARAPDTDNYLYGKGKIYFAPLNILEVNQGEIDLGNAPDFAVAINTETIEHFSSREGFRQKDFEATVQVGGTVTFTLEEINFENINIAFLGDGKTVISQVSGAAVDEAVAAKLDRWAKVDFREISSVVVNGPGGTPTYVLTTDYLLDLETGRVMALSTGSISADEALEISYNYVAWTSFKIRAITDPKITGLIRFIGTPDFGPEWELEFWKVKLVLDGEVPLIGEDITQISFTGEMLKDEANHPTEPFFRIFERNT